MKTILTSTLMILLYCNYSNIKAQESSAGSFGNDDTADYFFAFSLTETGYGSMMHFALIKPGSQRRRKVIHITLDDFLYQASGKVSSDANPTNKNFFKQFKIKQPQVVIYDIWKLRYKSLPYGRSNEKGWSAGDTTFYLPSKAQMSILAKYGMKKMGDYIMGDNAFRLLKNMEDSIWVEQYKEGTAN